MIGIEKSIERVEILILLLTNKCIHFKMKNQKLWMNEWMNERINILKLVLNCTKEQKDGLFVYYFEFNILLKNIRILLFEHNKKNREQLENWMFYL